MKNLKNYIQNIRFKTFFLFYVICMINVMFANSSKHIFKNGYHFFYFFFSILPIVLQLGEVAEIEAQMFKLCTNVYLKSECSI